MRFHDGAICEVWREQTLDRDGDAKSRRSTASLFLMLGLPLDTWIRLAVWLVIGLLIYFAYGAKHSRLGR